jgi:hypothetical protein
MQEARLRRAQLQQLTDRLIVEYAGAVPPGQVLAAVVRAQRLMGPDGISMSSERIALCERFVRQQLSLRLSAPLPTPSG